MTKLWLPFTQMRDARPRRFVGAAGNFLIDADGRSVYDATSSIWTIVHGHARPELVDAIARQAGSLDHATLLGATHPLAEELAEALCARTGLDYAFFSGDGASAVEAAAKMALQYWRRHGHPERKRFVRLVRSYHGDTVGAMSLSDIDVFKGAYGDLLFESVPYDGSAEQLERPDIAAIVVEPRVQAASGMHLVPTATYDALRKRPTSGPLLIVDEIATGFGRTGEMFAYHALSLDPDIVCVGKGLTGGILALSATLAKRDVYDAFLGDFRDMRQFFHGHSFAGNPIACAAALASLRIFDADDSLAAVGVASTVLDVALEPLRRHERVREIRRCGLMCGIEIRAETFGGHHPQSAAWAIADALYEAGYFTRPIGDTIQFVPPLTVTAPEIRNFVHALTAAIDGLPCT